MKLTEEFNSIKINAGERDGSEIAEQYKVRGFPTVIFIDKDGNEIDRFVGYDTPDNFIPMVNDILAGKNTISALEAILLENPNDYEVLFKIGNKYSDRGNTEISNKYLNQFLENTPDSMSDKIISTKYLLAKSGWENSDISGLQNFIKEYPDSDQCMSAYQMIARYYTTENDTVNEIQTLLDMTQVFSESSSAMNSYAWRMTELKQNLDDALIKAKRGVELAVDDSKSMILDTQAEIEWLLGDIESAIKTIKIAIELNPEDEYYQAQLEKFKVAN